MKQSLLFLVILFATVSCLKEDGANNDPRFISVEQYVALLKSGDFNALEIPIFEISDIPKLLEHTRNEYKISFSEDHLWSSMPSIMMNSTVGMMVLWTIESTRLDVDWPSPLPPTVTDDSRHVPIPQSEIADLYERWWNKNKGKTWAQLKEIPPFEGTGYSWH